MLNDKILIRSRRSKTLNVRTYRQYIEIPSSILRCAEPFEEWS